MLNDHDKEVLAAALARKGFRYTRQREIVFASLLAERDHPTADGVFERVREHLPTISLATVYNCLESLVDCQLVRQINFGKQACRYCPVHDAEPHYAHFIDTATGEVEDIHLPPELIATIREALPEGVALERLEISLTGSRAAGSTFSS